jgi:DNA-binding SARP family transcriptional activator
MIDLGVEARTGRDAVEFRILGTLEVWDGGRAHPVTAAKLRLILAALLLRPNRPVSADSLVDLLWGQPAPAAARDTLRSYVMRLRRALPDGRRLRTSAEGYLLEVRPGELDAERFAEAVARARQAVAGPDWAAVRTETELALALWRDRPLLDVPSAELERGAVPRL